MVRQNQDLNQINISKLGGLRRIELYGNPGTPEGRSKGGLRTSRLFHENPDLARKVGFATRKPIKIPQMSPELAEFFGIVLGDGGIRGNHQLAVSFNKREDGEYSRYVGSVIGKLFGLNHHIYNRKGCNGADLVVTSTNLINFLLKHGLVKGNKVKNQIGVPKWICNKPEYRIACLRGLMDTDGSFYWHRYSSNGKRYEYLKLCFTNASQPILYFVFETLRQMSIKAYIGGQHVSVYSVGELKKYFLEVKSNNLKHNAKLRGYLSSRFGEMPEWPNGAAC